MVDYDEFIKMKKLWLKYDFRNSAQKFRDKACGDCIHHRPSQPCNSGSYTNCEVTNASVTFGMKCNCGKFELI